MSAKYVFGGLAGLATVIGGSLVATYQLLGWALLGVAVVSFLASIDMIVNDKR